MQNYREKILNTSVNGGYFRRASTSLIGSPSTTGTVSSSTIPSSNLQEPSEDGSQPASVDRDNPLDNDSSNNEDGRHIELDHGYWNSMLLNMEVEI